MTISFSKTAPLLPLLILAGTAAGAQNAAPTATVIAIPPLATAKNVDTDAGTTTWGLANQISDLIIADLKSTDAFIVADVSKVRIPSYPEVTAPAYSQWRSVHAKLLLSGFVNARDDGRLTVGCYVYDVQTGRELARQGFAVSPNEWRRAAHRCADAAYVKASGKTPQFDSRIAYIAESGRPESPTKRLAMMDFDGANHIFLTDEQVTVLTPRWSPKADRIAYVSLSGGAPQVRIADVSNSADRPLLPPGSVSFAPAFSPDGQRIALTISLNANSDIYAVPVEGGGPQRLTASPAIDTSPSFSPDGSRIVFISDRSGSPQLYVMDSDGSNQRRISFGGGDYGSPAWSPDGERIAFARSQGPLSAVGSMAVDGSNERIVTTGPNDEEPAWSPDGSRIVFQRQDPATRRTALAMVPAAGGEVRSVLTPQGASDPSWAERQE
jgi:TolB protein